MKLSEREIQINKRTDGASTLDWFALHVQAGLKQDEYPVRFVVTKTDENFYHCEMGVLTIDAYQTKAPESIFAFRQRKYQNTDEFNVALVVPTGIDAEIGGDSGDAGALARFIAGACDNLITHPNVVNGADLNELPDNGLYVEGSVLSRLLMGTIGLQKTRANRVLLVMDGRDEENAIFNHLSINAASAARLTLGMDCKVLELSPSITMRAFYSNASKRAVGQITDLEKLLDVLEPLKNTYDAVAISSIIHVNPEFHSKYFTQDMPNPWGGVEAMLTHAVSSMLNIPSAHSPMIESREVLNLEIGVTDPRKAPEAISNTYLHCVLKGLHRSPKIITEPELFHHKGILSAEDISCLVIPDHCVGLPTLAALEQGIPVIAVRENTNQMQNNLDEYFSQTSNFYRVDNYLEAVGVLTALKYGIAVDTVRRPVRETLVTKSSDILISPQEAQSLQRIEPFSTQQAL